MEGGAKEWSGTRADPAWDLAWSGLGGDQAWMTHPCVMPETTSPPTETPSSFLGEPDVSLLLPAVLGTEEFAGPSAAAGRVASYDATAMGAAVGPCPSSLAGRGPNRRRGGE